MHDRAVRCEKGVTSFDGFAALASRKGALVCFARGLLLALSLLGIEGGGLETLVTETRFATMKRARCNARNALAPGIED
jgi:hypothetical protein